MTPPHPPAQHGAITLLVALGLVILASMTAFFSARSVLVDQLSVTTMPAAAKPVGRLKPHWPARKVPCCKAQT